MTLTIPPTVEPYLIGLWRFRTARGRREWAATYCYRGLYYDVYPRATAQAAILGVAAGLRRLRRRRHTRR